MRRGGQVREIEVGEISQKNVFSHDRLQEESEAKLQLTEAAGGSFRKLQAASVTLLFIRFYSHFGFTLHV